MFASFFHIVQTSYSCSYYCSFWISPSFSANYNFLE